MIIAWVMKNWLEKYCPKGFFINDDFEYDHPELAVRILRGLTVDGLDVDQYLEKVLEENGFSSEDVEIEIINEDDYDIVCFILDGEGFNEERVKDFSELMETFLNKLYRT